MTAGARDEVAPYLAWMEASLPTDPSEREKVLADPAALLALIRANRDKFPVISGASIRRPGEQAADILRLAEQVANAPSEMAAERLLGRLEAEPEAFAGRIVMNAKCVPVDDRNRIQAIIDAIHAERPSWGRDRLLAAVAERAGLSRRRLDDRLRTSDPRARVTCPIPAKKRGRPRK